MRLLTLMLCALAASPVALAAPAEPPLAIPGHAPHPTRRPPPPPRYAAPAPPAPRPALRRTFGLGVRMGSLVGGYRAPGTSYGDFGLGLTARFRPVDPLAIELAFSHHDEGWRRGSQRAQTMGQASMVGFLFPRFVVSPYLLGGLTVTGNHIADTASVGSEVRDIPRAVHWGPHGGIGAEIALGDRWALDVDVRTIGYVNLADDDATFPLQMQANVGVMVHF